MAGGVAAIIEAIAALEPEAQELVMDLIDHLRKKQGLPPVDWTAIDAQFQKDLQASEAARNKV